MGAPCEISGEQVPLVLQNHLATKEFQILDYQIKKASDNPLGFLGEHMRIVVNVRSGGQDRQVQYFAKKIPTKVQSHREYAEDTKAVYKEVELYKTLFVDMQKALSPERQTLFWRPECYYTRDWDLIIVQDLALEGYFMLPERTLMGLKYVQASLKAVARMHAGSIIFEEKLNAGKCGTQSTKFTAGGGKVNIRDLYPNLIFESECRDSPAEHPGTRFWKVGITSQANLVDILPDYTLEQKAKIKKSFEDTVRPVFRMCEPSDKFRNVITHADLWSNNLLFREGADETEAIVVDFQLARYAPPAQDVLMLLHIVQDRAFRAEHEASLLELYYKALAEELAAEGLDVAILLPRKEYDESCVFYKRYAVLNQWVYTQLNFIPPEIAGDFMSTPEDFNRVMYEDRTDIMKESYFKDEMCRARVNEAMGEIIDMFGLA